MSRTAAPGTGIPNRLARLSTFRWAVTLVAVSLLVSTAWSLLASPREVRFDEVAYVQHARDLAAGRGYVDEAGQPAAFWPVGYPAVLAAGYALFGDGKPVGITLQIVLSTVTCLLVGALGSAVFGAAIGRTAALLLAVYPTHVMYSTLHLTEPLFTLLLTTALVLVLRSPRSRRAAVLGGAVLGLAILVRPAALLLPVFILLWYLWQGLRRRALVLTVLAGCASLAVISPWLARNHEITGNWTTLATAGGYVFWAGNYPDAFGGYRRSREAMQVLYDGDREVFSRGYRLGIDSILGDPGEALVRMFRKVSYFFALETDGVLWNLKGFARDPPLIVKLGLLALANAGYVAVLALTLVGLLSVPRGHPLASLLLVTTAYFVVIALAFIGDPRYHYPLVPIAMIFASKALVEDFPGWLRGERRIRWGSWAAVFAGFAFLMAFNVLVKMAELRALG